MTNHLSHVDTTGRVAMVDTTSKEITTRMAIASARLWMRPETVLAIREARTAKGDPIETARLAGIMAAKRTSELIPLCHQIALTSIDIRAELIDDGIYLEAEVSTKAQTGVEMEALTAVTTAALTVYDMCKAIERSITITDIRLLKKTGGKSGTYIYEHDS
ncbi:MAG: cyclic pyranopterin monophosphate synthase MoaC [Pyrinomonadaceae bacterium]